MTLLISLVITAICEVFHMGILRLFFGSIEADVMDAAARYLVITAFSFPFLAVYNSSAALFLSMEKTNVTMYVSLLMNAINVAGNAINLAIVTVVGQCVGANEYGQAQQYTKKLMKISYVATGILGVAVCLALPLLLQFYELSDETYHLTCILVIMHNALAIALLPPPLTLLTPFALRGA